MNVNRLRYALNTLLVWMWMWLKGHMNSQVGLEFGHGSNPQQTFLIRIRTSTSSNKRAGDISFSAATPSPFSFSLWKLAMASIKRHLPQEDEHEAKKPKIACVSDAPELKEQHPVVLNPADCDLGISSLSKAFFFFFFSFAFSILYYFILKSYCWIQDQIKLSVFVISSSSFPLPFARVLIWSRVRISIFWSLEC